MFGTTGGPTRRARVKFEYNATEENQLSIIKGEEIDLMGDVTKEGWILARRSNGDEGYIPDKYFEVIASSPNAGGALGGRPPRPPPLPSSTASPTGSKAIKNTNGPPSWVHDQNNGGSTQTKSSMSSVNNGDIMTSGSDEYGLFAYQYEWFAIITLYAGGILSFLYATTLPDTFRVYFILLGILSVLMTTLIMAIVSQFRNKCNMCGCGTRGLRLGLFIFNAILLCPSPIGGCCAAVGFIAAIIEWRTVKKDVKPLPDSVTEQWGNEVCGNGGLGACSLGKLIVFFGILAVNIGCLGYGFSDGYNFAIEQTEEVSTDYYLNPGWTGMMYGCGRVITMSIVFMLLFGLKGCCQRQERNVRAKRSQESRFGKLVMLYADNENRRFFHRCLGYSIVWATLLHCECAYYSYEDSGSTHSFYDIYGWWILVSGSIALLLFGVIIASANDRIADQTTKFFFLNHKLLGAFFIFFLIFHGQGSVVISQWYWIFILPPLILYSCDALYRYARQDS